MIEQDKKLPHFEMTRSILNCCFEVMKELGHCIVDVDKVEDPVSF